jgi:hypothetical protein
MRALSPSADGFLAIDQHAENPPPNEKNRAAVARTGARQLCGSGDYFAIALV